jgi:hypothetical protein
MAKESVNRLNQHGQAVPQAAPIRQRLHQTVIAVTLLGFGMALLPIAPALARKDSRDDFDRCTADLIRFKVSNEEALAACSRALYPEYLGTCVRRLVLRGKYEATDALAACRVVRRPTDMAECTTDIRDNLKNAVAADVLTACRQSLLPNRYADCVRGLSSGAKNLPPETALNSCLEVQYFPRELDPTFIPYSSQPPSICPECSAPVVPAPIPAPAPAPAPTPAPVRGLY